MLHDLQSMTNMSHLRDKQKTEKNGNTVVTVQQKDSATGSTAKTTDALFPEITQFPADVTFYMSDFFFKNSFNRP